MKVRLNSWRGEHNPGDIVDLDDGEAAMLIVHGAAHPVDDLDDALDKAEAAKTTGKVVKGAATLEAATGTGDGTP